MPGCTQRTRMGELGVPIPQCTTRSQKQRSTAVDVALHTTQSTRLTVASAPVTIECESRGDRVGSVTALLATDQLEQTPPAVKPTREACESTVRSPRQQSGSSLILPAPPKPKPPASAMMLPTPSGDITQVCISNYMGTDTGELGGVQVLRQLIRALPTKKDIQVMMGNWLETPKEGNR